ncbi:MAG: hypothetical protein RMJ13_06865 [Elusimicrobiota bacterium]|nr:hypothetical protein [Elusimicrobiota bacterium]
MLKIFCYPTDTFWRIKNLDYALKNVFSILKFNFVEKKLLSDKKVKLRDLLLCKVSNINSYKQPEFWFEEEKNFEQQYLQTPKHNFHFYDGFKLQELYSKFIRFKLKECHIVFTQRIITTFDSSDGRYHCRVVVLGYPCIISISGFTKALTFPKEYYSVRNILPQFAETFKEDIYRIVDKNFAKFLIKYIFQCIFYIYYGEEFCFEEFCLHNDNHWFWEVYNQVKQIKTKQDVLNLLCSHHRSMAKSII